MAIGGWRFCNLSPSIQRLSMVPLQSELLGNNSLDYALKQCRLQCYNLMGHSCLIKMKGTLLQYSLIFLLPTTPSTLILIYTTNT